MKGFRQRVQKQLEAGRAKDARDAPGLYSTPSNEGRVTRKPLRSVDLSNNERDLADVDHLLTEMKFELGRIWDMKDLSLLWIRPVFTAQESPKSHTSRIRIDRFIAPRAQKSITLLFGTGISYDGRLPIGYRSVQGNISNVGPERPCTQRHP